MMGMNVDEKYLGGAMNPQTQEGDWLTDEYEGQLAIDAYQTDDEIIIKAPIAGVQADNLEVSVTDEMVTIKGERHDDTAQSRDNYFAQECYWGSFSRSYVFPVAGDADKAEAGLKNGLLTVRVPKLEKSRARSIAITAEE
jgi:HSP20 family protein